MGYSKLMERQKTICIAKMANKLLSACINRKRLKEDGIEYLRKNQQLAGDIIMMMDAVRDKLQSILVLNFDSEVNIDVGNNMMEEERNDAAQFSTAISFLSNTTQTSYNIVRRNIMKEFKIQKKDLPSYHLMTINRPKMIAFDVVPLAF